MISLLHSSVLSSSVSSGIVSLTCERELSIRTAASALGKGFLFQSVHSNSTSYIVSFLGLFSHSLSFLSDLVTHYITSTCISLLSLALSSWPTWPSLGSRIMFIAWLVVKERL
jgi:hypothetical protein